MFCLSAISPNHGPMNFGAATPQSTRRERERALAMDAVSSLALSRQQRKSTRLFSRLKTIDGVNDLTQIIFCQVGPDRYGEA